MYALSVEQTAQCLLFVNNLVLLPTTKYMQISGFPGFSLVPHLIRAQHLSIIASIKCFCEALLDHVLSGGMKNSYNSPRHHLESKDGPGRGWSTLVPHGYCRGTRRTGRVKKFSTKSTGKQLTNCGS